MPFSSHTTLQDSEGGLHFPNFYKEGLFLGSIRAWIDLQRSGFPGEFPGGLVVRICHCSLGQCLVWELWSHIKPLHTMPPPQKKQNKTKQKNRFSQMIQGLTMFKIITQFQCAFCSISPLSLRVLKGEQCRTGMWGFTVVTFLVLPGPALQQTWLFIKKMFCSGIW